MECRAHGDCGQGERCAAGRCEAPCTNDAQCLLLQACVDGSCVQTGCSTDRECIFLFGDGRATCRDKVCRIGCSTSYECGGGFEVCDRGECVFAGCQNDAECRAVLGLAHARDGVRAECR
ncbi:hypothetical protein [Vulgatibacter incomptus]|uniref:hypothetical protein n=1 Tax=Vulgatibacter incomptus TaxID=1391653 RepID=UPI0012F8819D|nr:hypothetical protein [Vulgatibacter incomptus]